MKVKFFKWDNGLALRVPNARTGQPCRVPAVRGWWEAEVDRVAGETAAQVGGARRGESAGVIAKGLINAASPRAAKSTD
jgi:hypothetical protein